MAKNEEETLDLLYGEAPVRQTNPETAENARKRAEQPRDAARDALYHRIRESDPELSRRRMVRRLTDRSIRAGYIRRQPCEICESDGAQAHHVDYNSPFNIMWLCSKCHARHHGYERRSNNKKRRRSRENG